MNKLINIYIIYQQQQQQNLVLMSSSRRFFGTAENLKIQFGYEKLSFN